MRKGILYGVGVGPGDPELITLKAVSRIKSADIVALPGETPQASAAYMIAIQAVPELSEKELLALPMPMKRDRERLEEMHEKNARAVMKFLDGEKSVAFLTLGDPNIYSTFSYIRAIVAKEGYEVQTIPGITSFCAAASLLNTSLADWDETLHIIPAGQRSDIDFSEAGTYVLMKPRGDIAQLKEKLKCLGRGIVAVTNCGMEGEKVYRDVDEIPDDIGYFTIFFVR